MAFFNLKRHKKSQTLRLRPETSLAENFINIAPSKDFIPEWYRTSPSNIPNTKSALQIHCPFLTNSTYKKCTPFFDAITIGYIVYLTADIEVLKKDDGMPYLMFRTQRSLVTDHNADQWEGLPVPDGYAGYLYKWHNDIGIKTPKNYSLLFTSPFNRYDLPFISLTGVVDTSDFNMAVHFPFFIKKGFEGIIEKGTPVAQIIPIKREKWARKLDKFNEAQTTLDLDKYRSTIKRSYKTNYWHRKEYQ